MCLILCKNISYSSPPKDKIIVLLNLAVLLTSFVCDFSYSGSRGAPADVPHKQRSHQVQCVGHSWSGEVWRSERWLLHSRYASLSLKVLVITFKSVK